MHLSWLGFDLDLAGGVISQYWKYLLLELHTVLIKYLCVLGLHPCYLLFVNGAGGIQYYFNLVF